MKRERLELALERLQPEQWKMFEDFASSFLSGEYPNLRTMASIGGDRGRDAQLFVHDGPIRTVLQYSVAGDWREKIRKTAKRLEKVLPDARVLLYVTNRSLGARADTVCTEVRAKHGLIVDVLDRSWFLERYQADEQRPGRGRKSLP